MEETNLTGEGTARVNCFLLSGYYECFIHAQLECAWGFFFPSLELLKISASSNIFTGARKGGKKKKKMYL